MHYNSVINPINCKIEYTDTDPQGLLMGLKTGKFDMLATSISYTEERAQSILFSDPAIRFNNMLAIRQESIVQQAPGLLESIRESYEKTFVREDRWKLIVEGIGTTCLITVSAALLGTALAFGICMLRRTGSKLANIIADIYVKIMQGVIPHLDRLGDGYPIQAVVEYSEADQTVTLSIRYGGDRFDPFTDGDEISTRLVRGITSETKYTYDSDNTLEVLLSEPK